MRPCGQWSSVHLGVATLVRHVMCATTTVVTAIAIAIAIAIVTDSTALAPAP